MTVDDLSAPLGQGKRSRRRENALSFLQLVAAALGASAITFIGWAMFAEDPLGGEPVAIAPVDLATVSKANHEKAEPAAPQQGTGPSRDGNDGLNAGLGNEPPAVTLPPSRTVTIIDGMSGRRQEVIIPAPAGSDDIGQAVRPAKPQRQ